MVPKGYDTVVLVDSRGYLTEGPGFNIGLVLDGTIYTPRRNCLQGITMSVVEDIALEQKIKFIKTDVPVSWWNHAEEIFLTSSSGGVSFVKTGPIVEKLKIEYEKKKIDVLYSKGV
jgi:branched-chain amino acid aminotransferase